MSRVSLCAVLGPAALIVALGSTGCNTLFGIEELQSGQGDTDGAPQGDAGDQPGTPDGGAPQRDASPNQPDGGIRERQYVGNNAAFEEQMVLGQDTLWAVRLDPSFALEVDLFGLILLQESSSNVKFAVYLDNGNAPGDLHAAEQSVTMSGLGEVEVDIAPFSLTGQSYWLVMLFDSPVTVGALALGLPESRLYRGDGYPYSSPLPATFTGGPALSSQGLVLINAYLVNTP